MWLLGPSPGPSGRVEAGSGNLRTLLLAVFPMRSTLQYAFPQHPLLAHHTTMFALDEYRAIFLARVMVNNGGRVGVC